MPAITVPRPRLDGLTKLRFFAAMAVVLYHSVYQFRGAQPPVIEVGYLAVGVFFTLSGVVLAWSWNPDTGPVIFWRRRAFRVLPLHWLTLALVVVVWLVVPGSLAGVSWSAFAQNATLTQAWPDYAATFSFNYPAWSLSVEAFFYLSFPLLMPLLARLSLRGVATVGVTAALAYLVVTSVVISSPALNVSVAPMAFPPLQLLKFLVGLCIGHALRLGWRPRPGMLVPSCVLGVALVAAAAVTHASHSSLAGPELLDTVVFLPATFLIIALAGRDLQGRRRVVSRSLLRSLGESSFALYLIHVPLLSVYNSIRILRVDHAPLGNAWLVVYLAVSVLAAAALHHWFEKPVERWGRRHEPSRRPAPAHA
jgi:peptidoglycan/LPS O-acetylase OafA/YrhL